MSTPPFQGFERALGHQIAMRNASGAARPRARDYNEAGGHRHVGLAQDHDADKRYGAARSRRADARARQASRARPAADAAVSRGSADRRIRAGLLLGRRESVDRKSVV